MYLYPIRYRSGLPDPPFLPPRIIPSLELLPPPLTLPNPPLAFTIPLTSFLSSSSRKQLLHHLSKLSPAIASPKSSRLLLCDETKKRTRGAACGWSGGISDRCFRIRVKRRRLWGRWWRFLTNLKSARRSTAIEFATDIARESARQVVDVQS